MLKLPGRQRRRPGTPPASRRFRRPSRLGKPEILFTKIEDEVIEQELKGLGDSADAAGDCRGQAGHRSAERSHHA